MSMDNFFGNSKQKIVWVICVLVTVFIASGTSDSGYGEFVLPYAIVIILIFAIISLILKSKKV